MKALFYTKQLNQSPLRKSLRIMVHEGWSAIVIIQLLMGPYLTGFLIYLGADTIQIGLILAIPALTGIIQPLSALYIQKITSRKWVMFYAMVSHRIIWVMTGFIPFVLPEKIWVRAYIVMFLVVQLINQMGSVILISLLSDVVPSAVRGKHFGIKNSVSHLIGTIAVVIGGFILEYYPEKIGFIILYGIAGICVIINSSLLAFFPEPPFQKSEVLSGIKTLLYPIKDHAFFRTTIFLSIWQFLSAIFITFFPYLMLEVVKLRYFPEVSVIILCQNITIFLSFYLWGRFNRLIPARKLILRAFPIIGCACLLWILTSIISPFLALIIIYVLLGIGISGISLLSFNFAIGDSPKLGRHIYIAFFFATTGFFGFLGSLSGGFIYDWLRMMPEWFRIYGFNVSGGIIMIILAFFAAPRFLK